LNLEAWGRTGTSDNINLAAAEQDQLHETIQIGGVDFAFAHTTPRTTTFLNGNVQHFHYVDNTFEDENVGGAALFFVGDIIPERVLWNVTENYGQQVLNTLQTITPGNRQNVNVLRTGPDFIFPFAPRTELAFRLRRSAISVDQTDTDNERNWGQVSLERQMNSTWSGSVGFAAEDVMFDRLIGSDFRRNQVYVRATGIGARSQLVVTVGSNEVNGDIVDGSGTLFNANFLRQISEFRSLTAAFGRNISDAGNIFRFGQFYDVNIGRTQDVVATADPFELSFGLVSFTAQRLLSSWAAQVFWRREDYLTQNQLDRRVKGVEALVRRPLPGRWEVAATGRLAQREFTGLGARDDYYLYSLEVTRQIGRSFGAGIRGEYVRRDIQGDVLPRSENRVFLLFNYYRVRTTVTRPPEFEWITQ
jgi:hypothetical protein